MDFVTSLGDNGFRHDPVVFAQFEECLKLSPSRLFRRIERPESLLKIREETLVMLARHYGRRSADAIAWKLIKLLCDRVSLRIGRAVRLWRLTPLESEEIVDDVIANLYDAILVSESRGKFWEIRFWVCFDRFLLSTIRSVRNRRSKTLVLNDDYHCSGTDAQESQKTQWNDPAVRTVVAEGLAQLPENLRTAFILKHWSGFAEWSQDRQETKTIACVMGVSDRTIRNYLSRAETILNRWRDASDE
jgi:DNA-directed RNA polymerase specialized sigma24 family protein